jgi:hypothetical protein
VLDGEEEHDERREGEDREADLHQVEPAARHRRAVLAAPGEGEQPADDQRARPERSLGEAEAEQEPVVGTQRGVADPARLAVPNRGLTERPNPDVTPERSLFFLCPCASQR